MSSICNDLRAAILQAAMQGKLTERSETDDSSERIKEQIIAERSRYKNCKFLDNSNDSVDFPDEWQSLKAGEVFELLIGEKVVSGNKLPLLDAKYFRGKQKSFTDKGNLANKDDVLILVDGENSGETFLCTESGYIGSTFKALFIPKCLNKDFALYFLEMNRKVLRDNKRGSAIPHLDKKLFFNFIFPIPPLAEQKRIVEKIDELMARVADLEKSADALASLKKSFPSDIRDALLQAAMQGKLTEQLPEDGDAGDLLEQIKVEKEKLVVEGKIKKQKPLAPIAEDEILFEIPENWRWVRLADIALKEIKRGKSPIYDNNGSSFAFAQKCNTKYDGINFQLAKRISDESLKRYAENDAVDELDIIVNSTGVGTLGRVGIIEHCNTSDSKYYPDSHVALVRVPKGISKYIYIVLKTYENYFEKKGEGSTKQKELRPITIQDTFIPLPPLMEQKRIVERLGDLLKNIDMVEKLITSE